MTITPKATRCASMCWRIITAHPGITARGIVGAQTDYAAHEVAAALERLEGEGLIERDGDGWRALVPFVVVERAWRVV
jgi:hypothetical protein